jgi:uncharacterized Zn-binding protein involved in type VI secretion
MPSPILHFGATVLCAHAGQAVATSPFPRVTLGGQPVATLTTIYAIAGCGLSASGSPPCVTGQWVAGATRVMAGGAPVATSTGTAVCVPTGGPLLPVVQQLRALAT